MRGSAHGIFAIIFLLSLMTIVSVSPASGNPPADSSWKLLPPIPDPVGFAGMFAGSAHGRLFAGGGSQFPDKPLWEGGVKAYSDRVFVFDAENNAWRELPSRLPMPIAHAASAPYGDSVIVAGGVNDSGALHGVYLVTLTEDELSVQQLPDLPHPLVYGAGAMVGDVFYVVGGVTDPASTEPSGEVWALSLSGPVESRQWRRVADFPGTAGIVPGAGSDGHCLYVFGGMAFATDEEGKKKPSPLASVFRYNPKADTWTPLADIPQPRVGASSPVPFLPDGKFLLAGGYGTVFAGPQKNHPGFEAETFIYDLAGGHWMPGPALPCERHINPDSTTSPGPEPMVAAPAVIWRGRVVIIGGEVRPGTRTPAVLAFP